MFIFVGDILWIYIYSRMMITQNRQEVIIMLFNSSGQTLEQQKHTETTERKHMPLFGKRSTSIFIKFWILHVYLWIPEKSNNCNKIKHILLSSTINDIQCHKLGSYMGQRNVYIKGWKYEPIHVQRMKKGDSIFNWRKFVAHYYKVISKNKMYVALFSPVKSTWHYLQLVEFVAHFSTVEKTGTYFYTFPIGQNIITLLSTSKYNATQF